MTTIAFSASNNRQSINHQLVSYVAGMIEGAEIIRLTDYQVPIYSIDLDQEQGIPQATQDLDAKLQTADKVIIAVPEYNGNMSGFFKNQIDWISRQNREFLQDKDVLLLTAVPAQGGDTVMNIMKHTLPFFGAKIVDGLVVKNFHQVFQDGEIVDNEVKTQLIELAKQLVEV